MHVHIRLQHQATAHTRNHTRFPTGTTPYTWGIQRITRSFHQTTWLRIQASNVGCIQYDEGVLRCLFLLNDLLRHVSHKQTTGRHYQNDTFLQTILHGVWNTPATTSAQQLQVSTLLQSRIHTARYTPSSPIYNRSTSRCYTTMKETTKLP